MEIPSNTSVTMAILLTRYANSAQIYFMEDPYKSTKGLRQIKASYQINQHNFQDKMPVKTPLVMLRNCG